MNLEEYIEILKKRVKAMDERIENKDVYGLSTLDLFRPYSDLYNATMCRTGKLMEEAQIENKQEETREFEQWVEGGTEDFSENQ